MALVNTELELKISVEFSEKVTLDRRNNMIQSSRSPEVRAASRPFVTSFFAPNPQKKYMSFGLQILFQSLLSMNHKLSVTMTTHSHHILKQLTKLYTPSPMWVTTRQAFRIISQ